MNKSISLLAAAAFSSVAFGDVTIDVDFDDLNGFLSYGDQFTGTLTAIEADLVFSDSQGGVWADDFTILLDNAVDTTFLQVGSPYVNYGPTIERTSWATGSSGTDGTAVSEILELSAGIDVSDMRLLIGNGYNGGGTRSGDWVGSITLIGIDAIPAPGALALLGIAGMGRRRRS